MSTRKLQLHRLPYTTSKFNFSIFQFFNNKRFDKVKGKILYSILYNIIILYNIEYNIFIVTLVPICYRLIVEKLKNWKIEKINFRLFNEYIFDFDNSKYLYNFAVDVKIIYGNKRNTI